MKFTFAIFGFRQEQRMIDVIRNEFLPWLKDYGQVIEPTFLSFPLEPITTEPFAFEPLPDAIDVSTVVLEDGLVLALQLVLDRVALEDTFELLEQF